MAPRLQETAQREYAPEAVFGAFLCAAHSARAELLGTPGISRAFQKVAEGEAYKKAMYFFNFVSSGERSFCPAIERCIVHFVYDKGTLEVRGNAGMDRRLRFAEGARCPETSSDMVLSTLGEKLYQEYLIAEQEA